MNKLLFILSTLALSNVVFATGGQVPDPSEKCSGTAKQMAEALVKEANTTTYEYQAVNKQIPLNDGSSVTITYDRYVYDIGKTNVASYLEVVLDESCSFVQAERIDNL